MQRVEHKGGDSKIGRGFCSFFCVVQNRPTEVSVYNIVNTQHCAHQLRASVKMISYFVIYVHEPLMQTTLFGNEAAAAGVQLLQYYHM